MNETWSTREARIDDAEAIVNLHDEVNKYVNGAQYSPQGSFWDGNPRSVWQWWMLDNPTGKHFSYVTEDNGRIIAHAAYIGRWFNIESKKVLAGYAFGRITHYDYWRKGIAKSTKELVINLLTEEGLVFRVGCASDMGEKVYMSWGSNMLGRSDILIKILNPYNVIYKRVHSKLFALMSYLPATILLKLPSIFRRVSKRKKPGHVFEVSNFDERFDDLWMKFKETVKFSCWKDTENLNWRYMKRPNGKYHVLAIEDGGEIYGFIVLRYIEKSYCGGYIVDFLHLPEKEDYASHLIDNALDHLRRNGADFVRCMLFKHNPYYQIFKEKGFIHNGRSGMWTINISIDTLPQGLTNVSNWFLMSGDTDAI